MADLTQWDPSASSADYESQKKRSFDLYKLLAENYDASGKIEEFVNSSTVPPGKVGAEAVELAKGLDVQWARQITAALVEDEVVDENLFDSDQALKALTTWIMETLGG